MRFLTALATTIVFLAIAPAAGAVEINEPVPPPFSNQTSVTFTLTPTAPYTNMMCQLDSQPATDCSSGTVSYTSLADGPHLFAVTASDGATADPEPTEHDWTVDTVAPVTTITQTPPATSNSASATFQFGAPNEPVGSVPTFQCSLDNAPAAPCTGPHTYTGLANGSHTFSVVATDQALNADATPATYTWTVDVTAPPPGGDTTPPDTAITAGPGGVNNIAQPSVEFTSSEAGSTFQCSVNGGPFATCSSPNILGALIDGAITFQVRAVDAAGNIDPTPAALAWTRDTTAPAAPAVSVGPRSGAFQTTTDLRARWAAVKDAASYDSDSRATPAGANPSNGKWEEIQKDGTDTQLDAVFSAGRVVCFRVRSTDAVANDSAFTSRCTSIVFRKSSGAVSRRSGYLRLRLNSGRAAVVKRVALVATKCPGCGSVQVVIAGDGTIPITGKKVTKRISLQASSRQRTRIITVTTFSSSAASLARRYVYVLGTRRALSRIEGIGVSPF